MSTRRTADPREVACIESQVDVLRRLQFPGVVPLEGFDRQGDTVTIQLGDDLPPLGEQPPGSAAECAALGAALSRTIGEVHVATVALSNPLRSGRPPLRHGPRGHRGSAAPERVRPCNRGHA